MRFKIIMYIISVPYFVVLTSCLPSSLLSCMMCEKVTRPQQFSREHSSSRAWQFELKGSTSKGSTVKVIEHSLDLMHFHVDDLVMFLCSADGRSQMMAVRPPLFHILLQQFQISAPDGPFRSLSVPVLVPRCFGPILFPKVKVLNELSTLIQIALALPLHILHDAECSLHALVQPLQ